MSEIKDFLNSLPTEDLPTAREMKQRLLEEFKQEYAQESGARK